MKYQSTGDLILNFNTKGDVTNYRHTLNLDEAIVTTTYEQDGTIFKREVFATPVDQVIVIQLDSKQTGQHLIRHQSKR